MAITAYGGNDRRRSDPDVTLPDGFLCEVMVTMSKFRRRDANLRRSRRRSRPAPVAVDQACGRYPVPIFVPCHRVVASEGGLRGYSATGGVDTERRLLDLEARNSAGSVLSQLLIDG